MILEARKHGNNVHEFRVYKDHLFFLISDLHWDNPKCDLDTLKEHLDEAVELGATILINGDFFCLMQGRYDGRRIKGDVRPEHNTPSYLDNVIDTAVEWFKPYAEHIGMIGYGNHETSILKHCETNVLQRFVDLMNHKYKTRIQLGGYGGYIAIPVSRRKNGKSPLTFGIHYYHGSGGGGVVTKGVIQNNRLATFIRGVDMIWQGHVHEYYLHSDMVSGLEHNSEGFCVKQRYLHHLRTPAYKEEYQDGSKGWHVERMAPPKPIGGAYLKLEHVTTMKDGKQIEYVHSTITPKLKELH